MELGITLGDFIKLVTADKMNRRFHRAHGMQKPVQHPPAPSGAAQNAVLLTAEGFACAEDYQTVADRFNASIQINLVVVAAESR
jgi:hypothetical protein